VSETTGINVQVDHIADFDDRVNALIAEGGGSTPRLDQVLDPTADKTFAMADHLLDFSYASNPAAVNRVHIGEPGSTYTSMVEINAVDDFVSNLASALDVTAKESDAAADSFKGLSVLAYATHPSGTMATVTGALVAASANQTGTGIVTNLIGLEVNLSSAGLPTINATGLKIEDVPVNGVTNGWAIKTGLGLVELGDALKVDGDIGFFGHAPAAKPAVTGSRGGNAALASLLTALAGLGLLTDSTS